MRTHFEAASASGDRLEVLYIVAVTTGMGRGELQGLKWEDLDLEAETLQVRRTLSEPKGGWIFEAPKSGKGRSKSASNDLWITCTLTSPFKYSTVARTVSPPGGWWTNRTSRTLSGSQWNLSHISRLSAVFILPYLLASVG